MPVILFRSTTVVMHLSAAVARILSMALVLSLWSPIISSAGEADSDTLIPIKTPKGFTVTAELADTPTKRARGLMFREHLADDRGMLFTFADAQPHTFWMKNTKIPLDIIWMDDKKKIIHIERNVPVCIYQDDSCPQYRPNEGALYVLELGGGRADRLQLQRGMRLDFKLP